MKSYPYIIFWKYPHTLCTTLLLLACGWKCRVWEFAIYSTIWHYIFEYSHTLCTTLLLLACGWKCRVFEFAIYSTIWHYIFKYSHTLCTTLLLLACGWKLMTVSTEKAKSPKSTISETQIPRYLAVQIQIEIFVCTEKFEFLDLVVFGGVAISAESVISRV